MLTPQPQSASKELCRPAPDEVTSSKKTVNGIKPVSKRLPAKSPKSWLFGLGRHNTSAEKILKHASKDDGVGAAKLSSPSPRAASGAGKPMRSFTATAQRSFSDPCNEAGGKSGERRLSNPVTQRLQSPTESNLKQLNKQITCRVQANDVRNGSKRSPTSSRRCSESSSATLSRDSSTSFTVMIADPSTDRFSSAALDASTLVDADVQRSCTVEDSSDSLRAEDEQEMEFVVQNARSTLHEDRVEENVDHGDGTPSATIDGPLEDVEVSMEYLSLLDEGSELRYEHLSNSVSLAARDETDCSVEQAAQSFGKLSSLSDYVPLEEDPTTADSNIIQKGNLERIDKNLQCTVPNEDAQGTPLEVSRAQEEILWLRQQLAICEMSRQQSEKDLETYRERLSSLDERAMDEERQLASYERRLLEADHRIKHAEEASVLQVKDLKDQLSALNNEYQEVRNQLFESHDRDQVLNDKMTAMQESLDLLREEKDEVYQLLQDEKAKTFRHEADFRLFSRKIRTLQEQNSQLHQEAEQLRIELRRMQYDAPSPSSPSIGDNFYKERLEEALLDNEALRALLEEFKRENDALKLQLTNTSIAPSSNIQESTKTLETSPMDLARSANIHSRLSSGARSPTLHRMRSFPAWERQTPTTTTGDRKAFVDRMRQYESEFSPTNGRGCTQLSPDSPFAKHTMPDIIGSPSTFKSSPDLKSTNGRLEDNRSSRRASIASTSESPLIHRELQSTADTKKEPSVDYLELRHKLSEDLKSLMDHKAKLTSEMSRIPASGGLGRVRRRKEELDTQLDEVDGQIGTVKRRMREMGML
ncbi:uncharacterized protein SPPG_01162 [Spizellomyces punctatus DAOM BR117]|uniref:Enkurin domain-containing protein n=1 Tax=Spizellomyces punctatus (strain DAOM BR117) TaxID=645134 RepID=A0A0L0HQN0_SPIPD|nr:uncharacterized protein SPPG_01162 [Spizellomyces punctatus DAOM BR117]KND03696.1 hypothetical protein SPPG_01162 [Spizellomyces punctatus DAOM BR117]|eukprot:XP_016611735.1 hypothetical protein SPPG_01162 [Spizellomyces punctatus DAOM BR117]